MGHEQTLNDAADRGFERPKKQMKMIVQQAVAEQIKGFAHFQIGERAEKCLEVARLPEDRLPIVAAVDE